MRTRRVERGQAAIFITLSVPVLFGMLGLVVDIGWAYWRKEACKTAADAAAMSAIVAAYSGADLTCGSGVTCQAATACPPSATSPPSNNLMTGCLYAQQNGFVNSGRQTVTIAANTTPSPITGVNPAYWVQATISENIPTLFSAVLGKTASTVSASSTAGLFQNSGGCIYVMDPAAAGALTGSGSVSLTSGCGIYVNSNNSQAVTLNGGAWISTRNGTQTNIVGNWNGGGTITPAPITGAPTITDPFALMPTPPIGACNSTGVSLTSHQTWAFDQTQNVICGNVNLGSQSSATFAPGTYVVEGSITLAGQASLSGTGVTLYITNGGSINIAGGATVDMTAPDSGAYQGVLFFQDRNDPAPASLVGGTGEVLDGVLYFPASNLSYTGGSSTNGATTTIVCDTLSLVGNSYINNAAQTLYNGVTAGAYFIQ